MMSRSRAVEDLARALDGAASSDEAPTAATEHGVRLVEQLTVTRSRLDEVTAARPEFRDALRTRLLAVAAVRPEPEPELSRLQSAVRGLNTAAGRRLSAVTAAGLAAVVACSGVAVAASQSLPGDALYGAKRTVQAARVRAHVSAQERGLGHLQLATTRLHELQALAGERDLASGLGAGPRPPAAGADVAAAHRVAVGGDLEPAMRDTIADMDGQVEVGLDLLLQAYRDERAAPLLQLMRSWSEQQWAELGNLQPLLPTALRSDLERSLQLVLSVREEADGLLGLPPGSGVPAPPLASPSGSPAPTPSVGPGTTVIVTPPAASPSSTPDPTDGPQGEPTRGPLPDPTASEPDGSAAPQPAPSNPGTGSPSSRGPSATAPPQPQPSLPSQPDATTSTPPQTAAPTAPETLPPPEPSASVAVPEVPETTAPVAPEPTAEAPDTDPPDVELPDPDLPDPDLPDSGLSDGQAAPDRGKTGRTATGETDGPSVPPAAAGRAHPGTSAPAAERTDRSPTAPR